MSWFKSSALRRAGHSAREAVRREEHTPSAVPALEFLHQEDERLNRLTWSLGRMYGWHDVDAGAGGWESVGPSCHRSAPADDMHVLEVLTFFAL